MTSLDEPAWKDDPNWEANIAKGILDSGGKIPIGVSPEDASKFVGNFLRSQRDKDDGAPITTAKQQTIVGHSSGAGNRHVIHAEPTFPLTTQPIPSNLGGGKVIVTVEDVSGYSPGAGVGEVDNVDTITFDQDNFEIYDGGGGQCVVKLKTCPAVCS